MNNALVEDYLRWLAPQLRDGPQDPDESYWDLISIMFEKEYCASPSDPWFIPHDDNRCVDGTDLRAEFCHEHHIRINSLSKLGPCSFLELLIGLSRRLSFMAGGSAQGWAWQLILNLELGRMSDPLSKRKVRTLDHILDTVIQRTYNPDGYGGFFPLTKPDDDQTVKELWYQMAAYIDDINPEH